MGLDFMRALRLRGHEIEVLTGFPNYPGGKIYPGYKIRCRQVEIMDGIKVVRVPLYPSHDRSGIKRIMTYASFGISAATIGQFGLKKPDLVYAHAIPTSHLALSFFRWFRNSKIVLHVQDLWPDSVMQSGMMKKGLMLKMLAAQCNAFYRKADGLVVISPGFKKKIVSRGVQEKNIEVVYNWCDEKSMLPVNPAVRGSNDPFLILYAGNMGIMQALGTVLDAAQILQSKGNNIRFRLIGPGVEAEHLRSRAESMCLNNVEFLPPVPQNEITAHYENADALLIHLKDIDLFKITVPSKTQAYLHSGRPILCGVGGDASSIVEQAGAGLCFQPENAEQLAEAALRMSEMPREELERMGRSGQEFYREHLCFDKAVDKIDAFLRKVANK